MEEQVYQTEQVPPWRVWEGLLILVLSIFLATLVRVGLADAVSDWQPVWLFVMTYALQTGLLLLGLCLVITLHYRVSFKTLGFDAARLSRGVVAGLCWAPIIFLLVAAAGILVQVLLPWQPSPQFFTEIAVSAKKPVQLLATVFVGVLLAPFGEELLFRGFLYPAMRRRVGVTWAVALNAALFAGLHMDLVRFLPLAVGGAGLALLYERSKTLYAPITAHGVWNAISLVFLLLYGPR